MESQKFIKKPGNLSFVSLGTYLHHLGETGRLLRLQTLPKGRKSLYHDHSYLVQTKMNL
jgi:hypothetical protein